MGAKLDHELAANDGTITFVRGDSSGHSGNMLILTGTDGWKYWYLHINNDTPGTDDGRNPARWRFAPGIAVGVHVKRGQFIAYMGDSGEAETTDPHLHFELHRPDDTFIDPYTSLRLAQGAGANGLCSYPSSPAPHPNAARGPGLLDARQRRHRARLRRRAKSLGAPGKAPRRQLRGRRIASTATGRGYWVVDAHGDVRTFGDAVQYGGMRGTRAQPARSSSIVADTDRQGLLVAGLRRRRLQLRRRALLRLDRRVRLNAPIISMAPTAGRSRLLVARRGRRRVQLRRRTLLRLDRCDAPHQRRSSR